MMTEMAAQVETLESFSVRTALSSIFHSVKGYSSHYYLHYSHAPQRCFTSFTHVLSLLSAYAVSSILALHSRSLGAISGTRTRRCTLSRSGVSIWYLSLISILFLSSARSLRFITVTFTSGTVLMKDLMSFILHCFLRSECFAGLV
jgi:hypothetical protein